MNFILYIFNSYLLYNYTPYDLYFCDFVVCLVSDEDAACLPGVICFFVHYPCFFATEIPTDVMTLLSVLLKNFSRGIFS